VHLEKAGPVTMQLTLSTYELAALIAAARWAHEGGQGELAAEARDQLGRVLESYDENRRRWSD